MAGGPCWNGSVADWLFDPWDLDWVRQDVLGPVLDWLGPQWSGGDLILAERGQRESELSAMPRSVVARSGWEPPEAGLELRLTRLPEVGSIRLWSNHGDGPSLLATAREVQLAMADHLHEEVCETGLGWGIRPPRPDDISPPSRPPTHWRPAGVIPQAAPKLRVEDGLGIRDVEPAASTWGFVPSDDEPSSEELEPLDLPARITLPDCPSPDLVFLDGWRPQYQTWTLAVASTVIGRGLLPHRFDVLELTPERMIELDMECAMPTTTAALTTAWISQDGGVADATWYLEWPPTVD